MGGVVTRAQRIRRAAAAPATNARNFLGLCVLAFFASALGVTGLIDGFDPIATPASAVHQQFTRCMAGGGDNCVIDGDTFILGGIHYRIADIDTPETRQARCAAERALGERATSRLAALLSSGPFELAGYERDEDVYGRKLRVIRRGGDSLGLSLVAEGFARPWDGRRHPWC